MGSALESWGIGAGGVFRCRSNVCGKPPSLDAGVPKGKKAKRSKSEAPVDSGAANDAEDPGAFVNIGPARTTIVAMIETPDGKVLAATPLNAVMQFDGKAWLKRGVGMAPDENVVALYFDRRGNAYASTKTGFFVSADQGSTWKARPLTVLSPTSGSGP